MLTPARKPKRDRDRFSVKVAACPRNQKTPAKSDASGFFCGHMRTPRAAAYTAKYQAHSVSSRPVPHRPCSTRAAQSGAYVRQLFSTRARCSPGPGGGSRQGSPKTRGPTHIMLQSLRNRRSGIAHMAFAESPRGTSPSARHREPRGLETGPNLASYQADRDSAPCLGYEKGQSLIAPAAAFTPR